MKLTDADYQVLQAMNRGMYLIYKEKQEGTSINGCFLTTLIKSGTIKRLLDLKLIEMSKLAAKRYRLTDEGRKYK